MAKRSEPQSSKDRNFFPPFADCPGENDLDDRYFMDADPVTDPQYPPGSMKNRKHWCLLGEIIQADTLLRPRIVARDAEGGEFVVAFYPDNPNDMPRLLRDFKVGYTIAVFYALKHLFLDRTAGRRAG
ncbi:hypothetical protein F5X99DRAFT_426932 [Biscogniauxia marginata]|nr:hypothetical protein F5X99DRAFT_426932 [Biscogniauxia marginata]